MEEEQADGEEDFPKPYRPQIVRPRGQSQLLNHNVDILLCSFVWFCGIGSVISFDHGGSLAYFAWRNSCVEECSVEDLQRLQRESKCKFRCQDGYVDVDAQVIMTSYAGGPVRASLKRLSLSPVYKDRDTDDGGGASLPVALVLAEDGNLASSPCDAGLCGVFASPSADDACGAGVLLHRSRASEISKLTRVLAEELKLSASNVDELPIVDVTDPSGPGGGIQILLLGIGLYSLALLGFLTVQLRLLLGGPAQVCGR